MIIFIEKGEKMRKAKNIKVIGAITARNMVLILPKKESSIQKTFLLTQINILVKHSDWRVRLFESVLQDAGSI